MAGDFSTCFIHDKISTNQSTLNSLEFTSEENLSFTPRLQIRGTSVTKDNIPCLRL